MPGLAGFALAAAPIAGGALLTMAAGQFKAPDFRGLIKQDQDVLLMGTASKCAALGVAVGWGCGSPAQDSDRGYGRESRNALKPWCSST
jgi:hypothetical protein